MTAKDYCEHCKATEDLLSNGVNPNGNARYYCRSCNAEKARRYRSTEIGRLSIYKAVYKKRKNNPQNY